MRTLGYLLPLGLVGAVVASVGCPGSLDDPSRFEDAGEGGGMGEAGCPDVPSMILATTCGVPGCHSTVDHSQGLDLQAPGVASRVVGVCAMGGGVLVDPNNPSQSVLYGKLTATPPFGSQMPLGRPALDPTTLACVLSWISSQQAMGPGCGGDAGSDTAPPPVDSGADVGVDSGTEAGD